MSNYNSTLQSNNIDLQAILDSINALPNANGEQATPVISISSNGLITATAGAKSSTRQLAFQAAKTITPSTTSQIAVSSGYYTGGNITVAGDSNLVAGNIKSGISIFGVSGTLVEGDGGGETVVDDASKAIINGTITEFSDDSIEAIRRYAFYGCSNLTTATFPACTFIGSYAFYSCSSLTTINFPVCASADTCAFGHCSNLTTVNFPIWTSISNNTFYACRSLTDVSFPACTSIGYYAFGFCYNLPTVSFPVCTTIGSSAFAYCGSLTTASFPACTFIDNSAFANCTRLSSLYLTNSAVCTLSNSNAFSSTPYAGYSYYFSGTPRIYVPASLVESYRTATNWTYFSSYITIIPPTPPVPPPAFDE